MNRRRWAGLSLGAVMLLLTLAPSIPARADVFVDDSGGSGTYTFSTVGQGATAVKGSHGGVVPLAADAYCWAYQDTYKFGNAVTTQGSGTFHIQWCANTAKTKVTSFTKGQFWCSNGPYGFYTYDGCSHRHGTVPDTRVSYHVEWHFHFLDVYGIRINKTMTLDGYVYPNGGITGTIVV